MNTYHQPTTPQSMPPDEIAAYRWPAVDRLLTPADRQELHEASRLIGRESTTRTELGAIKVHAAELLSELEQARRRFTNESIVPDNPYVTDAMRQEARNAAHRVLAETENDARRRAYLLGERLRHMSMQLDRLVDTPDLASVPERDQATAARLLPLLQAELPTLRLSQLVDRLHAVRLRGDAGESLALATAARAHLAERANSPRPGDATDDLVRAEEAVRQLAERFRDTRVYWLQKTASEAGEALRSVDTAIRRHLVERGAGDYAGWLDRA